MLILASQIVMPSDAVVLIFPRLQQLHDFAFAAEVSNTQTFSGQHFILLKKAK